MVNETQALVEISKAQQALERASSFYEMRTISGVMEAAALFAERQGLEDVAQQARVMQLKADRKAGGWLRENVDRGNPQLVFDYQGLPEGITKKESHKLQVEASLSEERFNAWIDECLASGWEITAGALRRLAQNHSGNRPSVLDRFIALSNELMKPLPAPKREKAERLLREFCEVVK